jgi:hypothetical protein
MDDKENKVDNSKVNEQKLVAWVVDHTDRWRDWRNSNYLEDWKEYERIFRGQWASEDKTRESERSRLISPATQQAVETRHAEIMEAIMGSGEFFDIADDIKDVNGNPLDIAALKAQLHEDFNRDKIKKAIDQIELMAEIYGTGIGEVVVREEKCYEPKTQAIPGQTSAAIGVQEYDRVCVKILPINPKNFIIDANATCVEDALGVAVDEYQSIHKIVEGMEKGKLNKVEVHSLYDTDDLQATQETTQYQDDNVRVLRYYGLVPKELLSPSDEEVVDLFPEDSGQDKYSNLVEAIVVIANGSVLLKATENQFMMKDRPIIAYQDDTVPGRFYGRGTVEKAYNMQKAIDGTLRADMDSRALTTAPMVAMDATRLPRGAKFEVKPGKALLTNGNPAEILMPFTFGQHKLDNAQAAQNYERMLLQATGTVDSAGMPSQVPGSAGEGVMSLAMAGIIKKYKRTLTNFQEDFLIPFINKAAWRYMQFDPERYPSADFKFLPTGCLGILAREFEQSQFINLLKTLGPDSKITPLVMKGIISNSSLSSREELMQALQQMMQPNPQEQQMGQAKFMKELELLQAQIDVAKSQAAKNMAEAGLKQVEMKLAPVTAQTELVSALSNNLDDDAEGQDFERRAKIADLMLKERDLNIKESDIHSNERIAIAQMHHEKALKPSSEPAST